MTDVKTTCPYCGVGCGIIASADGSVRGDPDHPANYGRLCSKGSSLGETIGLEGRLLHPKVGDATANWDSTLDLVAGKFKQAVRDHGPDSVAFYVSGQLLTEDYYVANKLMKGFIGSANIDTNSRLCMASSVAGHKRAFGTDTVPGQYEDFEQADLVVLVGSNLAWCHPVLFQRLSAAKAKRAQMRVVTVDPRRTATAEIADLVMQIAPDGDAALFNLLLTEIAKRRLIDRAYTSAHVKGVEDALAAARQSTAAETGLADDDLKRFLDLWCNSEKVVTVYSQGVNQSAHGTDKVNAILNCHLATGRIGRPGMGPFSVTGQPNAMGGREVGGLANMLACHLDIENQAHRDAVQTYWDAATLPQAQGLRAVDMFDACLNGKIKALWIMSTNPAVSMPDANRVREAIMAVPFTVVSDILEDTDTTRLADVVLPAKGWGEKSGTVTNSERCISRQRPFLPSPGSARADWDIIADVGRRMGWEAAFSYASEGEVFDEYAAMSALSPEQGKDFDITGLSGLNATDYDAMPPTTWPVPKSGGQQARYFADGTFYHADGKARMVPVRSPAITREGVRLNTGRVRDQWHTMTRTGRAPRLGAHLAEPYLEIHPQDAIAHGLSHAALCRVSSAHGSAVLRVLISDKVPVGVPFAPMHWTDCTAANGRVNAIVPPMTDPISSQPALKAARVEVTPFDASWYGYLVSVNPLKPMTDYAAIARAGAGWSAEVAGGVAVQDWQTYVRQLSGVTHGDVMLYEDPKRGDLRIGIWHEARLIAAAFIAASPVTVSRAYIREQLGTQTEPLTFLAGRPLLDAVDKGAIVCSCFSVGVNQIQSAIADGASDVAELGACLGAGTNCGSCLPELNVLLRGREPVCA